MPMYNLLEISYNYSMTSGSLRTYYREGIKDDANENDDADNNGINNNKTVTSKYFEYKAKILGRTTDINNTLDKNVVVPLKYLSKF